MNVPRFTTFFYVWSSANTPNVLAKVTAPSTGYLHSAHPAVHILSYGQIPEPLLVPNDAQEKMSLVFVAIGDGQR